jgi:GTP-binding protein HflX
VVDSSSPDHVNHEKTVDKLLKELGVEGVPVLTIYNKRDQTTEGFTPAYNEEMLHISALEKEDIKRLTDKIESLIKVQMDPYHINVPSSEGKLIAQLKQETVLTKLVFTEEEESYTVEGYYFNNSKLASVIQQRMKK